MHYRKGLSPHTNNKREQLLQLLANSVTHFEEFSACGDGSRNYRCAIMIWRNRPSSRMPISMQVTFIIHRICFRHIDQGQVAVDGTIQALFQVCEKRFEKWVDNLDSVVNLSTLYLQDRALPYPQTQFPASYP